MVLRLVIKHARIAAITIPVSKMLMATNWLSDQVKLYKNSPATFINWPLIARKAMQKAMHRGINVIIQQQLLDMIQRDLLMMLMKVLVILMLSLLICMLVGSSLRVWMATLKKFNSSCHNKEQKVSSPTVFSILVAPEMFLLRHNFLLSLIFQLSQH